MRGMIEGAMCLSEMSVVAAAVGGLYYLMGPVDCYCFVSRFLRF